MNYQRMGKTAMEDVLTDVLAGMRSGEANSATSAEKPPSKSLSEERRDGFMKAQSLLEKALLRRFDTNFRVVGSPAVLNTIQTTPPLIPFALPSTPTPPSGVYILSALPPRDDAARSIDTSHTTLPANSLTFSASSTKSEKLR